MRLFGEKNLLDNFLLYPIILMEDKQNKDL